MKIIDLIALLEGYKYTDEVNFKLGDQNLVLLDTVEAKHYLTIYLEEDNL